MVLLVHGYAASAGINWVMPGVFAALAGDETVGKKVVVAALRLPYDLASFPEVKTYLCTYGIQSPSIFALASVLFGEIPAQGKLPVSIPELYPVGHHAL